MIKRFGDISTITSSSTHDFLGMKIRFTNDKKVEIDMTKQVKDLITDFEQENEMILSENITSPTTGKYLLSIGI